MLIAAVALVGFVGLGWFVMSRLQAVEKSILSTPPDPQISENIRTDSVNRQAYDLYVRGKVKAGSENREETGAAIKILEEAVAIDPNFAEAFAQWPVLHHDGFSSGGRRTKRLQSTRGCNR